MAARGKVHLVLPDGVTMQALTDLTGYGCVSEGEEFTAREVCPFGGKWVLQPGGRKLLVRVQCIEKHSRGFHQLHVVILKDLTPEPTNQSNLFE